MRILSVNVGLPRELPSGAGMVRTAIYKSPVAGRVPLRRDNFAGDAQADLAVHGGPEKAVYAYPAEHYTYWTQQLPGRPLPPGVFGENLTLEGATEETLHVGDELLAGTARLVITQPRLPCFKLGLRFDDPEMVTRFRASNRPGFYLAVLEEGEIGPGDAVQRLREDENRLTVAELFHLMVRDKTNTELMRRALRVRHLAAVLRHKFEGRLAKTP